uniref:putative B3 domain-containing protein Os03g0621600 n=1 Tax=Erigeron canadensis TaxID=72917 RepID=UPI001CB8BB9D|nr:putative B3 domain-containing protein Os03g0621600 [Erigeron canadensis]
MGWMTSSNGHLWLQNGWPQFVQHYNIKIGHLLLFNHQKASNFHVRIFNHNMKTDLALEKENKRMSRNRPLTRLASKKRNKPSSRNRALNVLASKTGNKRTFINRATKSTVPVSFKTEKPFCSGLVGSSGISTIYLPTQFCRRYLTSENKCVDCVLQMPKGGNWGLVQCKRYEKSSRLSGKNWRKFYDDNHLVEGDVCVFELVNKIEKVLNVIIIRANTSTKKFNHSG